MHVVGTLFLIFFPKYMDKLKLYIFSKRTTCFRHYMKFPAILVNVHFLTTHPPTPSAKQWKYFFIDLSISWNFLHFWFKCTFYPPPPPTPLAKQWKYFLWIYQFHEISCNFSLSAFSTPPPHTPTPLAKQWKNLFSWIYPFHEISCNFGSSVLFTPPLHPSHRLGQTVKKIFSWFIHAFILLFSGSILRKIFSQIWYGLIAYMATHLSWLKSDSCLIYIKFH